MSDRINLNDFNHYDLTYEEAINILDNIEGLVAVDENGIIKYCSKDLLCYSEFPSSGYKDVKGVHITDFHPHSKITTVLSSGFPARNYFYTESPFGINIARILPIYKNGILKGAIDYDIFRNIMDLEEFMNTSDMLSSPITAEVREKYLFAMESLNLRKSTKYHIADIIGNSAEILHIKKKIAEVATTDTTVLIIGETGSGKELVAHSIYNFNNVESKKFVEINCAAIPESLMESEFFGYEEGTFTGAVKGGKAGIFEQANGGTLFLDEINQLPYQMQPKLLRVLQEKEITRIGGNKTIPIDVRIIAATNKDLRELVADGTFREDLYYRLNVFEINIPPLRERKSDIPLLVKHILNHLNQKLNRHVLNVDKDVIKLLHSYSWPGNVRELQNVIERTMITTSSKTLTAASFKSYFSTSPAYSFDFTFLENEGGLNEKIQHCEKQIICDTLEKFSWNISKTANALKISRPTLYYKMENYKIVKGE